MDERASLNRRLVARMHDELLVSRDPARVDEFFSPDFVTHNPPPGMAVGREGVRAFLTEFANGLQEISVHVDVMLAEGDLVAVRTTTRGLHRGRLFGLPPSGRRVAIDGIDILRVQEGLIAEHWGLTNTLGLLRQVGRRSALRRGLAAIAGR